MDTQIKTISDQQRESWNRFSPGWKKWDAVTMDFLKPMGDEIIHLLNLNDNDQVLDVASGTGEPGLSIASHLKGGKVIACDLSEGMLQIAKDNAAARGIKNFEVQLCNVSQLPFADHTFDAISCRFGFMFFPDMLIAAKEMLRVLKPGGRLVTSVWNIPEKNFWATASMGVLMRNMHLPPPTADTPGLFRCAEEGMMADLFSRAGFKNVSEREITGKFKCENAEHYWTIMTEVAAPIATALDKADEAMKNKIKAEVIQLVTQKYPGGNIAIDASALVISGDK